MNIKNILLLFVIIFNLLLSKTNTFVLDITAQARDNSGNLGISDYVRLKMQDAEPYEDCGIDQCCDKFEAGGGGCLLDENPNYDPSIIADPNGDNYHPINNPNGYEKNGRWDGDIYNDSNQNCMWDPEEMFGIMQDNGIILDRVGTNFEPDGIFQPGEIYYNLNELGILDESLDFIYPDCIFEEGGTDGWRQGEDEFDIPAPMDGHTNIRFSHLEWMNEYDINGNQCCMDGIYFSVDKRSWKNYDEVSQWDIYGNTWQLNNINGIKFSWDKELVNDLVWIDGNDSINYELYIFIDDHEDGKFNYLDTHVNMNTSNFFVVDPEYLISSGEGSKISVVLGECALEGTDTYKFDNDGDGWTSCSNTDGIECPKELCPGAFTGEYRVICNDENCIQEDQFQINCPENFTYERILNIRNIEVDIEDSTSTEFSNSIGSDGKRDNFLTTCRYNEYIKYYEVDAVFYEFLNEGNNYSQFYLEHDCTIEDNQNNCQEFNIVDIDGDGIVGNDEIYNLNTNLWVQKWFNENQQFESNGTLQQDVNDMIYCKTNDVDDCLQCALEPEDFNKDLDCMGECFGLAEQDDCGICQSDIISGNFKFNYEHFIEGPDVDCNGECLPGTPKYAEMQNEFTEYGNAEINDCGICVGGNTIHIDSNGNIQTQGNIDLCYVCPPAINAEPFNDCGLIDCALFDAEIPNEIPNICQEVDADGNTLYIDYEVPICDGHTDWQASYGNGTYTDGEEFLDLIDECNYFISEEECIADCDVNNEECNCFWNLGDGIGCQSNFNKKTYTSLTSEYLYTKNSCWHDSDDDEQWDNEEPYTDENQNGQYDEGEDMTDFDGNGQWTPAEVIKLPGECVQSDPDYIYEDGTNCDGACFFNLNTDEIEYSRAFLDDCSQCSCDALSYEDELCFKSQENHLPNSGTNENSTYCTDLIFSGIQDFSALSRPKDEYEEGDIDSVILEWDFYPTLNIVDPDSAIWFKILTRESDSIPTPWNEIPLENIVDSIFSYTYSFSGDEINFPDPSEESLTISEYGIKVADRFGNESEIGATSLAEEYYKLEYTLYNGNNLISFPGYTDDDNLSSIFGQIHDYTNGIIGQAIASSYIGNDLWVGTIGSINSLSGYWLSIEYEEDINNDGSLNDPLEFILEGVYPANPNQSYALQSGANLVSYVGDSLDLGETINDQVEIYFKSIISEGVAASQIDANSDGSPDTWVGSLLSMQQKKGYWILLDLTACPISEFDENPPIGECILESGNKTLQFRWNN